MTAMDCTETFQSLCAKIGVVDPIIKALESRGFTTPAKFFWPLKEGSEETFGAILDEAQIDIKAAASMLQSAEAGCLRRLLHECRTICDGPPSVAAQAAPAVPAKVSSNLFGFDVGPRLTSDALQKLWSDFTKNYPAEVIVGDTRPCKALVQMVFAQKAANELRFIPWRQILSEAQADRAKQAGNKEKTFLDVLADAAGHVNALEQDPSPPSHYGVQRLLLLRSVAWALVGWCHLGAGRRLVQAFMGLYAAPGLGSLGLRSPTLAEAEHEDGELRRQLNALLSDGFHFDSALHEVVVVRHSLQMWLQPKPKVVNAESVISAKGPKRTLPQPLVDAKRPRGRHGKGKMSETPHQKGKPPCFAFKQHGKCSFGDACKFDHSAVE